MASVCVRPRWDRTVGTGITSEASYMCCCCCFPNWSSCVRQIRRFRLVSIATTGQVIATKHPCTLRMWLCIKCHGAWLHGVHRPRGVGSSFMWHQPCPRCKYTASVYIQKGVINKLVHSCRITCECSESVQGRMIALYKSCQQLVNNQHSSGAV